MFKNPYKYQGPLDPVKDESVCIKRLEDIDRVRNGMINSDYWAIIGPHQIGKTTFLRQLQHEFPNAYYLYFNFEVYNSTEQNFYREMIKAFINEIPIDNTEDFSPFLNETDTEDPGIIFYTFLEKFKPREDSKKIILMFDEIDEIKFLSKFLHSWRRIYHERYYKNNLNRYIIILAGTLDLIEFTTGPNSPFNIASILDLKDFSKVESSALITRPMNRLNIKIEPDAQEHLISQVSGHPQILQQLCHLLTDTALKMKKIVVKEDIDNAIKTLFKTNFTLDTLKVQVKNDENLSNLLREILSGTKKRFFPYKKYSSSGVGPIVDQENFCAIRNEIYKNFLENILNISSIDTLSEINIRETKEKSDEEKSKAQGYDCILLYNIEDNVLVKDIALKLKQVGIGIRLDQWDMRQGMTITEEIIRFAYIKNSVKNSVVMFIGKNGSGPWINAEIRDLLRKLYVDDIRIIPVILPNSTGIPDLPSYLPEISVIDFRDNEKDAFAKLVSSIEGER